MGKNKYQIINADCITAMKKMENEAVDLILTDPPYNLGKFMKDRATNLKQMRSNFFGAAGWDDLEFSEWETSMDEFFEEAARIIKYGGTMIVFMSIIKVETIIKLATKHGFYYKTTGIWHKQNPMPRNNVQKIVGQIAIILHGRHTTSQGHIQRKFGVAFLPRPEVKVKRYVFPK